MRKLGEGNGEKKGWVGGLPCVCSSVTNKKYALKPKIDWVEIYIFFSLFVLVSAFYGLKCYFLGLGGEGGITGEVRCKVDVSYFIPLCLGYYSGNPWKFKTTRQRIFVLFQLVCHFIFSTMTYS